MGLMGDRGMEEIERWVGLGMDGWGDEEMGRIWEIEGLGNRGKGGDRGIGGWGDRRMGS